MSKKTAAHFVIEICKFVSKHNLMSFNKINKKIINTRYSRRFSKWEALIKFSNTDGIILSIIRTQKAVAKLEIANNLEN